MHFFAWAGCMWACGHGGVELGRGDCAWNRGVGERVGAVLARLARFVGCVENGIGAGL